MNALLYFAEVYLVLAIAEWSWMLVHAYRWHRAGCPS